MQRSVIILAYFLFFIKCLAQQYPFVHYTPREGLVNNKAKFIFQDSQGKIYIATYGGLSIYDGSRFTNFDTNNGLADNLVNDIVEMGKDSVWILVNTQTIHCMVNGRLKTFSPDDGLTPVINKLIKCSDGFYYAATDEGLYKLQDRRFVKVDLSGLPPGTDAISINKAVEFDNKLFLVSDPNYKFNAGNLLVYDLIKKKLIAYKLNLNTLLLYSPSPKELWIASYSKLYTFNGIDSNKIILTQFPYVLHNLPEGIIPRNICRDRQNNLWITTLNGLYKINPDGDTTLFTKENGLTINFQTSILQDHENNMWFTNEYTGVCKLSNQQLTYYPEFRPGLTITDIFVTPSSDSVWLYDGDHGQVWLTLPRNKAKKFILDKTLGSGRFLFAKKRYVTIGNNIYSLDKISADQKISLIPYYTDKDTISGFTDALMDKNGNLVTASTSVTAFVGEHVLKESFEYMTDQFTIDQQNRIWVAPRSNKLYCFKISDNSSDVKLSLLKKFETITTNSPRSITADNNGNIWIGTRGQGLFYVLFDGLTIRSIKHITTRDGLTENFVSRLFCDKDNNIWASSPSGVDRIKFASNSFLIENITKSNNFYLPTAKVVQAANGMIWILTSAGIITYNPYRAPIQNWKPKLIFYDNFYSKKSEQPIPQDHELKYFQNNLSFLLSAPTYIDEKQTRFTYLLDGSGNNNWSEPSTNTSINLVNLAPGEYTLKAKAIFLHGFYSPVESAFSFKILPPWWQTLWFKIALGLTIIVLLIFLIRYYINRKLELQRVQLEKKRAIEKERTRIASDMHDDLGAGLSQIKFLSETIGMKKQKHQPIDEDIESIRTFSGEMIDKMGEIVWALNEKNDTLSDLLSYTRSFAVQYLEQNGIVCHVIEPENIPLAQVSGEFRRNIYLTVKECLHNIIKHAEATEVSISININNNLNIIISDNGIGIDKTAKNKFGNGLTSMRNRIADLGGTLKISGYQGTTIDFSVPLS